MDNQPKYGDDINYDAIRQAYGFAISVEGELMALVAGDMGYDHTGIFIDSWDEYLKDK